MLLRTRDEIQSWLSNALARVLQVEAASIDPQMAFADMGLDSMVAVELSGDLADWLGGKVSPMVVWDYPNVAAVAEYLASRDTRTDQPTQTL